MHFIPNGIVYLDFFIQICLKFLQKHKCIKKFYLTLNFKKMKKLEILQMENLQGGWTKCDSAFLMAAIGISTIEFGLGSALLGIGGSYWFDRCMK